MVCCLMIIMSTLWYFLLLLSKSVSCRLVFFFFFKQKTAYEMLRSLVGSEMCIRDRSRAGTCPSLAAGSRSTLTQRNSGCSSAMVPPKPCLLYTSDAADDLLCVDLGGRRIIKKKTQTLTNIYNNCWHKHDRVNTTHVKNDSKKASHRRRDNYTN